MAALNFSTTSIDNNDTNSSSSRKPRQHRLRSVTFETPRGQTGALSRLSQSRASTSQSGSRMMMNRSIDLTEIDGNYENDESFIVAPSANASMMNRSASNSRMNAMRNSALVSSPASMNGGVMPSPPPPGSSYSTRQNQSMMMMQSGNRSHRRNSYLMSMRRFSVAPGEEGFDNDGGEEDFDSVVEDEQTFVLKKSTIMNQSASNNNRDVFTYAEDPGSEDPVSFALAKSTTKRSGDSSYNNNYTYSSSSSRHPNQPPQFHYSGSFFGRSSLQQQQQQQYQSQNNNQTRNPIMTASMMKSINRDAATTDDATTFVLAKSTTRQFDQSSSSQRRPLTTMMMASSSSASPTTPQRSLRKSVVMIHDGTPPDEEPVSFVLAKSSNNNRSPSTQQQQQSARRSFIGSSQNNYSINNNRPGTSPGGGNSMMTKSLMNSINRDAYTDYGDDDDNQQEPVSFVLAKSNRGGGGDSSASRRRSTRLQSLAITEMDSSEAPRSETTAASRRTRLQSLAITEMDSSEVPRSGTNTVASDDERTFALAPSIRNDNNNNNNNNTNNQQHQQSMTMMMNSPSKSQTGVFTNRGSMMFSSFDANNENETKNNNDKHAAYDGGDESSIGFELAKSRSKIGELEKEQQQHDTSPRKSMVNFITPQDGESSIGANDIADAEKMNAQSSSRKNSNSLKNASVNSKFEMSIGEILEAREKDNNNNNNMKKSAIGRSIVGNPENSRMEESASGYIEDDGFGMSYAGDELGTQSSNNKSVTSMVEEEEQEQEPEKQQQFCSMNDNNSNSNISVMVNEKSAASAIVFPDSVHFSSAGASQKKEEEENQQQQQQQQQEEQEEQHQQEEEQGASESILNVQNSNQSEMKCEAVENAEEQHQEQQKQEEEPKLDEQHQKQEEQQQENQENQEQQQQDSSINKDHVEEEITEEQAREIRQRQQQRPTSADIAREVARKVAETTKSYSSGNTFEEQSILLQDHPTQSAAADEEKLDEEAEYQRALQESEQKETQEELHQRQNEKQQQQEETKEQKRLRELREKEEIEKKYEGIPLDQQDDVPSWILRGIERQRRLAAEALEKMEQEQQELFFKKARGEDGDKVLTERVVRSSEAYAKENDTTTTTDGMDHENSSQSKREEDKQEDKQNDESKEEQEVAETEDQDHQSHKQIEEDQEEPQKEEETVTSDEENNKDQINNNNEERTFRKASEEEALEVQRFVERHLYQERMAKEEESRRIHKKYTRFDDGLFDPFYENHRRLRREKQKGDATETTITTSDEETSLHQNQNQIGKKTTATSSRMIPHRPPSRQHNIDNNLNINTSYVSPLTAEPIFVCVYCGFEEYSSQSVIQRHVESHTRRFSHLLFKAFLHEKDAIEREYDFFVSWMQDEVSKVTGKVNYQRSTQYTSRMHRQQQQQPQQQPKRPQTTPMTMNPPSMSRNVPPVDVVGEEEREHISRSPSHQNQQQQNYYSPLPRSYQQHSHVSPDHFKSLSKQSLMTSNHDDDDNASTTMYGDNNNNKSQLSTALQSREVSIATLATANRSSIPNRDRQQILLPSIDSSSSSPSDRLRIEDQKKRKELNLEFTAPTKPTLYFSQTPRRHQYQCQSSNDNNSTYVKHSASLPLASLDSTPHRSITSRPIRRPGTTGSVIPTSTADLIRSTAATMRALVDDALRPPPGEEQDDEDPDEKERLAHDGSAEGLKKFMEKRRNAGQADPRMTEWREKDWLPKPSTARN